MLLDTPQTAKRTGKSVSWLNHARQTGDGPEYLKIGHAVRYRVEDVDRWLESKARTRIWDFDEKDREAKVAYQQSREKAAKRAPPPRKEQEASGES